MLKRKEKRADLLQGVKRYRSDFKPWDLQFQDAQRLTLVSANDSQHL
jgi:hypothetical protein